MSRNHSIVHGLDHSRMVGVEIGPWYSPIAPRAAGWNTVVVDFCSGDELREKARTHSSATIRTCEDKIEDVDVVWRGQQLDEALLAIHPDGYDFLIASHVMEHIPDLIGFLKELKNVIKPEGVISLAMPDMRFCFDFFKPLTMTDAVLLAHRERRIRHSPETLFSAHAYQSWLNGNGAWYRDDSPDVDLICPLRDAFASYLEEVARPRTGQDYVDAHAWIFSPANFCLVILELNALGLIDFRIRRIKEGEGAEFFAQLELGSYEMSDAALASERAALLKQMVAEQSTRHRFTT